MISWFALGELANVETTRRVVSTRLIVYNILGREISTLVNKQQKPGYYEVQQISFRQQYNLEGDHENKKLPSNLNDFYIFCCM